jgi:hypothetical protein
MNFGKTFFAYLYSFAWSNAESRYKGAKRAILYFTLTESVWESKEIGNKQQAVIARGAKQGNRQ